MLMTGYFVINEEAQTHSMKNPLLAVMFLFSIMLMREPLGKVCISPAVLILCVQHCTFFIKLLEVS